jgi:hypothetical protein
MLKLKRHRTDDDDTDRMERGDRGDVIADDRRTDRTPVTEYDDPTIVDRDRTVSDREDTVGDRDRTIVARDRTIVDRDLDDDHRDDADRTVVREPRPVDVDSETTLPPPPEEAGVRVEQVVTETTFSPGQMIIMLAGAVSLALGIAAIAQGGLGGSVKAPVVQIFDFDHTPALGLIEAGAGIVLLLTGLHASLRALAGLVGALMVAAGVVVLAEIDWVQEYLAAEQGFGWVPIAIGGIVLLAAFVLPATSRRRVTVVR